MSMTVPQFLNRVARRSRTGDFTGLALNEKLDVLQAANAALQRLYDALPAYLRETTQGFTLPAPISLSVAATAGSPLVSTGTFAPTQLGCSIVIPGDAQWNQIVGPQNLRNPYTGTTGTQLATVYGDALFSTSYPFDRIIGNPRFSDPGSAALIPVEMSRSTGGWNWLFQSTLGRPMTWWPQYMGNSQGANPMMVMRFAPAPDQAYSIHVQLAFWAMRLQLTDEQAATTLTVPDQILDEALIPMAVKRLMLTPIWKSITPADDARCEKAGIDGEAWCRNQVADPAAPANRAYTPLGY